jgi:DNA-binding SARP family transcriptional activator/tetratricopeptide (TPR) repeat protein
MEFRILGPVEVVADGQTLALGAAKQKTLLAILLLRANRVVSRDELIEALWGELPPPTAPKALQVYVSRLRKALGPDRIMTRAPGYLIRVDPGELDLERFERLVEKGGREQLAEGLALWRGRPLADFTYERFAQPEIGRLEELRLAALEERIEADLVAGRHAELVGELETLVAEHPLRERLRGQRMLVLYRCGRQAEALEAYQAARRVLVEELGIEPRRELRELHQAILRQDPALDAVAEAEPAAPSTRGPFVGRESELAELLGSLGDAFSGRGRLCLVAGEPGIGKSRLADEVIAHARAQGARVLVGRCWEAGGAPPYWPWVQSIRVYLRDSDPGSLRGLLGEGAANVAQIVPELRELLPDLPEPASLDPAGARFRLFDSVTSFLLSVATERPLVLVLDDLHAADEPSLLLLRFVARELGSARLLLVGAYRDVDPTVRGPLASAVADLVREPATRRIELAGLEQKDVAEYIELTAELTPDETLVAAIHTETEGNPLFVAEVVRLLASERRLGGAGDPPLGIPQGVRDAIGRRLGRLSGECREVLALASVLGREFGLGGLERMSGLARDELLERLEEAVAERVVTEVAGTPDRLRFSHVLVRDSLYESLPAPRRLRLHRRAAEALEQHHARHVEPHLAELAHQFLLGGGTESGKAFDYARRSADQAMAQLAYEEAVRLYRMAHEALELERVGDESIRCELLLALGDAEAAAGEGAASKETFFHAAEIARGMDAAEPLARAALGFGGRFAWSTSGGDTRLVPLLEEALAALSEADAALRARLLARLACALRDHASPERRDALSREAVEIARALGDPATQVYTLMGRRVAVWAPENIDELLEITGEIVRLADEAGEPERAADTRLLRLEGHLIRGDMRGAHTELEAAARLAAAARRPSAHWHVEVHRAELALLEGRFADAERHIAETVRLGEQAQVSDVADFALIQTVALRWAVGGLGEISGEVERLAGERPARPIFRCLLALLDLELGHEDRARPTLETLGADDFAAVPRDEDWMLAIALLAEVAVALGDPESAAVLYRMLEPYGDLVALSPHAFGTGSAARSLGAAASTCGRFEEAERHFHEALATNERIGALAWLARAKEDYARMLLGRDEHGDRDKADRLLAESLAGYRSLGAEGWLRRASGEPRRSAATPAT